MKKKYILTIVLILIIITPIIYLYQNIRSPSYVLLFEKNVNDKIIIKDIKLLKKHKYKFISCEQLNKIISKKQNINPKTIVMLVRRPPSDMLLDFINSNHIPVTFIVNKEQISTIKNKHLSYGIEPVFPTSKPIIPNTGYVNFNFDDAWKTVYTNSYHVFKKENIPASIFVVPKYLIELNTRYLSVKELTILQSNGWEIGSHSYAHKDIVSLGYKDKVRNLIYSKSFLTENGFYIKGFAIPFGSFKSNDILYIKNYYSYARTSFDEYNVPNKLVVDGFTWENNFDFKWAKKKVDYAKKNRLGIVFLLHDVSNNKDKYAISKKMLTKIIRYTKSSNIPIYSNLGIHGKPLFLKKEFNSGLENDYDYIKRLNNELKKQKTIFNNYKIYPDYIYYPEGITTNGLVSAATKSKFSLGFSKKSTYLNANCNPMDISTISIHKHTIKKLINQ